MAARRDDGDQVGEPPGTGAPSLGTRIVIEPASSSLAEDLAALAAEATTFGIGNSAALVDGWIDGTQRYDRQGEALLVAWDGDVAIGVGGLAQCPDVEGALRVRRFYVAAGARRRGVAGRLATQLIDFGFRHTDTLTCNARASIAAGPFWEAMGFLPVEIDGITHIRTA